MEITLNKNKSFSSINEIQNLNMDLTREEKLLPISDLQGKIDAYEQYLKEKDACNKYRFVFTIHPYCTNVLFNHITEAVYHEGSEYAKLFLSEKDALNDSKLGYAHYKKDVLGADEILANTITRDTGYSSDYFDTGYLNYNCGVDILNNHHLRRKEFVCINKLNNSDTANTLSENIYFNTLFDKVRDPWGNGIQGFTYQVQDNGDTAGDTTTDLHLYNTENIYPFKEAIAYNLKEEDGWIGFTNTALLDTIDTTDCSQVNRVINNHDACTFIDMYPTREHYSFVPYFNKIRKRLEKNWEYLLTYPFENVYHHTLIRDDERNINGLLCDLELPNGNDLPGTVDGKMTLEQLLEIDEDNPVDVPLTVMFHTHTKHSLVPGDRINLHIYNNSIDDEDNVQHIENLIIGSIGDNGYDTENYFSVRLNEISTEIEITYNLDTASTVGFRFEKIAKDKPCRYYIRKFKKLPNFKNTEFNISDGITDSEINETLETSDFSSAINKLGFSKTIYGDDIAQIVYDDDIDISGLKDNLGRSLSQIYLTIVKTNYGHEDWYRMSNGVFIPKCGNDNVEFSHCFGTVTSGFDLPSSVDDVTECNVRRQHNIVSGINNIQESSEFLENDIQVKEQFEFYGDIVELNESALEETVLENIYHRFNTAQREFCSGTKETNPFSKLIIDNIVSDDYSGGFSGTTDDVMCNGYWANLAPEGYYYQAHYPIRLKEYDTTINTGYHTKITVDSVTGNTITTDVNYYLEKNKVLYLYHQDKNNTTRYIARIGEVSGDDFRTIELILPSWLPDYDLSHYIMFKPNILMPDTAYDFGTIPQPEFVEKTGRYIWRDILPSSKIMRTSEIYDTVFTNGAIYMHKDINFYLKRQDPFGEFGLLPEYNDTLSDCVQPADIEIIGNDKDISNGMYFEPGENNIC